MHIRINQDFIEFPASISIIELLNSHFPEVSTLGLALAINDVVIPKSTWKNHLLTDGDCVLLIRASQGG